MWRESITEPVQRRLPFRRSATTASSVGLALPFVIGDASSPALGDSAGTPHPASNSAAARTRLVGVTVGRDRAVPEEAAATPHARVAIIGEYVHLAGATRSRRTHIV